MTRHHDVGGSANESIPLEPDRHGVRPTFSTGERESEIGSREALGERIAAKIAEDIRQLAAPLADLATTANTLPPEYRAVAFGEFARFLLEAAFGDGMRVGPTLDAIRKIDRVSEPELKGKTPVESGRATSALERVELALGMGAGALQRVLQIEADGSVQVLARVEGRSISERQVKLAQMVCYVREKGLGEMKTDIEILRTVCVAQGQYDSANFAANFRRDGTVLEARNPGSKERLFMLSREGVESAAALLRQLGGY